MKDIIGKIKGATDRGIVIGIAIIILLIIIFGVVRFTNDDDSQEANVLKAVDGLGGEDAMMVEENQNDSSDAMVADRSAGGMKVRIPVLAGELFDMTQGIKRGCDSVVFIERTVPTRAAVLNATLSEMFSYNEDLGFLPGNFVARQENLFFSSATIENGVAKVFLTGGVDLAGVCDDPRVNIQVEEAAKQFSTVNSVEVYLNGEVLAIGA